MWSEDSYPYVLRCECAVLSVTLFRERVTQFWIKVFHHSPGGVQVLEEQKHEGEFIQKISAKNDAPECRVGPDERTITKLNH